MIFLREKGPYEKFPIRFQTSCNDQKIWNGLATLTLRVFTIIDIKRGLHLPFPRTTLARLLIMAIIFRTFQAGNRVNNVFHHTMRTTKRILRTLKIPGRPRLSRSSGLTRCPVAIGWGVEGQVFRRFRCDPCYSFSLARGAVLDCTKELFLTAVLGQEEACTDSVRLV